MASIPAILTGAGSGFLVGGPVGAAVGAGAGWLLGPRPAVEVVNTPVGPGVLVQDAPDDPTVIPEATQASAAVVNQLVATTDTIDYQPYPPRYVWNQSDALAGIFDSFPGKAIGAVAVGVIALLYLSKRR